jgi:hypothetical protein
VCDQSREVLEVTLDRGPGVRVQLCAVVESGVLLNPCHICALGLRKIQHRCSARDGSNIIGVVESTLRTTDDAATGELRIQRGEVYVELGSGMGQGEWICTVARLCTEAAAEVALCSCVSVRVRPCVCVCVCVVARCWCWCGC